MMPSVLVIDDELAVRESMRQVLTRTGFEVVTADNGVAGVEAYFEHPTDVVIVDYPKARIIAMTGGGNFWPLGYKPNTLVTDAYLTLASQSGADALMKKPFRRQNLIETVRGLVEG